MRWSYHLMSIHDKSAVSNCSDSTLYPVPAKLLKCYKRMHDTKTIQNMNGNLIHDHNFRPLQTNYQYSNQWFSTASEVHNIQALSMGYVKYIYNPYMYIVV